MLDEIVCAVREGESRALVIRGEAGVGKSALLEYVAQTAGDLRVLQASGIESEMELAFAAVHQLCTPLLGSLPRIPGPQRTALETVFGLTAGVPPDRFTVGLGVLSLLSEAAGSRPVMCLVDDSQWLDAASAHALAFAARRLLAESVGLVLVVRDPSDELAGLPQLEVGGLSDEDARALLESAGPMLVDERIRDRIVSEAGGNPLALLELPLGLETTELGDGLGLPTRGSLAGTIEASFLRRIDAASGAARSLLLLAASEPIGDAILLRRAADLLGIDPAAVAESEDYGLLDIGERVTFRHPLVRSAIYGASSISDRRAVHRALGAATDPAADPDRRAWHFAAAATGPDESVALELERCSARARARGGLAAAAAFLQRAVVLTAEPSRRTDRLLAAAHASVQAGRFETALQLVTSIDRTSCSDLQRARSDLLRGQIASATAAGSEAPVQLLRAAQTLEGLDHELALETYLDAWGAALFAGSLSRGCTLRDVSLAALSSRLPMQSGRPSDLLLSALSELIIEGCAAAAPALRMATRAFSGSEISVEKGLQWGGLAAAAAVTLWDFESWLAVISRQVELAREAGALSLLSVALSGLAIPLSWCGDFVTASTVVAEADVVSEATQTRIAPYGAMLLRAYQGQEGAAVELIDSATRTAEAGGEGLAVQFARFAEAVLNNGLSRYEQALAAARQAIDGAHQPFLSAWALAELVEASARTGKPETSAHALDALARSVEGCETDWGAGTLARARALCSEGDQAGAHYLEALERLSRTPLKPEIARSHLLYGEWLRRGGQRVKAREHLRASHEAFSALGMEAFAERARRELQATGAKARKRTYESRDDLTAQESQIASLAAEGLSNPEIGARLFLRPRTVEWHLRKVFSKLGITSRKELGRMF